jgi:hypothetical protein
LLRTRALDVRQLALYCVTVTKRLLVGIIGRRPVELSPTRLVCAAIEEMLDIVCSIILFIAFCQLEGCDLARTHRCVTFSLCH